MKFYTAFIAVLIFAFTSCSLPSFYQKNYELNKAIETQNYSAADEFMKAHEKKDANGRNRFLYYVNAGTVASLAGKYEESNTYFEKAYIFIEDERKQFLEQGAALLLNPNLSTYFGEDHEVLMIHYYKALNYVHLGDYEKALVECRRLDLRLQALSDKYKSDKKYKKDAFIHTLMGLIYDANNDYNNAFIAYRNAYLIYENEYKELFKLSAPLQLKKDLVRTADLGGLWTERDEYIQEFGIEYERPSADEANAIVIWNNGLGPVKQEWGLNFAIVHNGNGWVSFVNKQHGMSFPFYIGNNDLRAVTWVKAVFPRYVVRPNQFTSAEVIADSEEYPLELAQNINAISNKVLSERMALEMGKSLFRTAMKQAAAYKVGQKREGLGTLMSIVGNASESADTRNWQTLPASISYTRVPVSDSDSSFIVRMKNAEGRNENKKIDIKLNKGQTKIVSINTLQTRNNKLQ
ncbi:COG3014 family protein [Sediminitomix flava]|uniref:Tetratricopeptide repeat protein n=1 Tax=Sediminitomix flava TaxID=379075 RepID=A0A315Z863_SEDFL|nr:hypothetical protein [Sediminitomix flava]PWJ40115.1 hypothetical protein BC781_105179 [Sediminitomix flava]